MRIELATSRFRFRYTNNNINDLEDLGMQDNYDLWQTRKTTDLSQAQRVEFEAG